MLRNERVRDYDILATGTGQAGHLPVIVDVIILAGQQERAEIRYFAALDLPPTRDCTQVHPTAMVTAAREGPAPTQAITAGRAFGLASRGIRRRIHDGRIIAPYLVLSL